MKLISSWCVSFLCIFLTTNISPQINEFYIRLNQVGFLPEDMKSGVILSEEEIPFSKFTVIDQITNEKVFSGKIRKSEKNYSTFNYCYNFDFTKINNIGKYIINVGNESGGPVGSGRDHPLGEGRGRAAVALVPRDLIVFE